MKREREWGLVPLAAAVSLLILWGPTQQGRTETDKPVNRTLKMTQEQASAFARLALKGLNKEYPNKPSTVLNSDQDIKSPRALHPAFYGCFDWHSSVHGHWMLVRLLRLFPDLPERQQIRKVLAEHLTAKNLQAEADYFGQPNRQSFERTYGWAWLLKLAEELHAWDDPDARQWSQNLRPLTDIIVARYLAFLPKQTYPIRSGVHPNTAFGLAFALDYAQAVKHKALRELVEERSRTYFGGDAAIPAGWEPDGADFFSPSLMEADLMRRVLPSAEFQTWLQRFLPDLARGEPKKLFAPATVTRPDRSADCPPGRAEPEPGLVHAQHRGGAAGRRSGPQGPDGVGGPTRRGRSAPRGQRRLCRRALAGLVRRLPVLDPGSAIGRGAGGPGWGPLAALLRAAAIASQVSDARFWVARPES